MPRYADWCNQKSGIPSFLNNWHRNHAQLGNRFSLENATKNMPLISIWILKYKQ
jgi:hypothetical protein